MVDLVNRFCAEPYISGLTAGLPKARRWRDELWGVTKEAAVVIYNTDLVPLDDAPRTRFDLLDLMRRKSATYSGKIATYDIEESGLGYLFAFMDSQQATTFGGFSKGSRAWMRWQRAVPPRSFQAWTADSTCWPTTCWVPIWILHPFPASG